MNYIQHVRAAHEWLLAQPRSRPIHISLYLALFRLWNLDRFPEAIQVDRREVMSAARIGNRDTYTAALRDLETWGMISYQPSHDNAKGTRILMAVLEEAVSPKMSQPPQAGTLTNEPTTTAPLAAIVGQPVSPEVSQLTPSVAPLVSQPSLLSKTSNVNSRINAAAAPEKKGGVVFSGEGHSTVEVLDDTAKTNEPAPARATAPQKTPRIKRGAPKKMRVEQLGRVKHLDEGGPAAAIRVAATAQTTDAAGHTAARNGARRQRRPELPFTESAINTPDKFAAAFEGTDYALADLAYYFQRVSNWRDKNTGEPPHRTDWIATARNFMLNDAHDNRLKLAPGTAHVSSADAGQQNPGIPTTGYRSSRWD